MTSDEAVKLSLKVLKSVMEEKITSSNVQVAVVSSKGYNLMSEQELQVFVASLA
jgi:20S proteasome alpha/beta subunit